MRKRVYICAPMAGDTVYNIGVAKKYVLLAIRMGRLPICTHLMGDLFDDNDPEQRRVALNVGISWVDTLDPKRDELWQCGNLGVTQGMDAEIQRATARGIPVVVKTNEDLKDADIPLPTLWWVNLDTVAELYEATCPSFSPVHQLTDHMRQDLRRGFADGATVDDYKLLFRMAEDSAYLKKRGEAWPFFFEWLIKPDNMAKVLGGRYDDAHWPGYGKEASPCP